MRTIWLASYPKSGNTWMRMLLGALDLANEGPIDINSVLRSDGTTAARGWFDNVTLLESGLLTFAEIDALRPRVYEARTQQDDGDEPACGVANARFVKVHDAYTLNAEGEPLLAGARGADGAVLIVRDPRDVAPSLANHNGSSIDAAIEFMANVQTAFCSQPDRQHNQLRQLLGSWSWFVATWLDQRDIPVHLVRYEDLHADAEAVLAGVLEFAGEVVPQQQIRSAVARTNFAEIKAQERKSGFREAPRRAQPPAFFRRGECGAWRDELTAGQVARIEAEHAPMMRRLSYPLAYEIEGTRRMGAAG